MGALALVGGLINPGIGFTGTQWFNVAGGVNNGTISSVTTEAQAQMFSAAGTWALLTVHVTANNSTATLRFRKNAANGNQVIAVGAAATGFFQDALNSDVTANNDKVALEFVQAGTTTYGVYLSQFDAGLSTTVGFHGTGALPASVAANLFLGTGGYAGQNVSNGPSHPGTEASVQAKCRAPGTFSHMAAFEAAGSQGYRFRVNGANGTQAFAAPGAGGLTQDAGGSDVLSSGDLWCYGTLTATDTIDANYVRQASSSAAGDLFAGDENLSPSTGQTDFLPIVGALQNAITESQAQASLPFGTKFSNLRVLVYNAAVGQSATLQLRVNGVSVNEVLSTGVGATGYFEDALNSDTTNPGDLVAVLYVALGSGSMQFGIQGITYQPSSTPGNASGALGSGLTIGAMTGSATGTATGAASGALGSPLTISPMLGFAVANAQEKSSKVVAYAAEGPADASLEAVKVVAGAVEGPDDGQIESVKVVAYVIEGPPPPPPVARVAGITWRQ